MSAPGSDSNFLRRCGPPLLLGLIGVAALGLQLAGQPLPPLPAQLSGLPHGAVVALSLVNPLLLVVLGALLAHRVGLRSAAAGTAPVPRRADLAPAGDRHGRACGHPPGFFLLGLWLG